MAGALGLAARPRNARALHIKVQGVEKLLRSASDLIRFKMGVSAVPALPASRLDGDAAAASVHWASGHRRQAIHEGAWKVEVKEHEQRDGTVVRSISAWFPDDAEKRAPLRRVQPASPQRQGAEAGMRSPKRRVRPSKPASPQRQGGDSRRTGERPEANSAQRRSARRSAARHASRGARPALEEEEEDSSRDADAEPPPDVAAVVPTADASLVDSAATSLAEAMELGAPADAADASQLSPGKRVRSPAAPLPVANARIPSKHAGNDGMLARRLHRALVWDGHMAGSFGKTRATTARAARKKHRATLHL